MKRTSLLSVAVSSLAWLAAGCGSTTKKVESPVKVTTKPVKKPVKKPPPVCVPQSEQSVIGMSAADGDLVQFCVADGNGGSQCFSVELDSKKLEKLTRPPIPQAATLATPVARLQSTPSEVTVCTGDSDSTCKALKPRIKKSDNPIEAAVNGQGTVVAMLLGDAESGKGVAEVWSVAKKKKLASIKYAKGDYRCGTAFVLDDLVFISAGVCAGPAARGALYTTKGKKVADLGGKDFGTYGTVPIQLGDHRWAFLSETGGVIAIHDSKTGKLEKTIDLLALWAAPAGGGDDDEGEAPAAVGGNPGESALLRGADGKLLVVTGSPHAGNVGVVDVDGGTVEVVAARPCPAGEGGDDDADDDAGDDDAGDDDDDGAGGAADDGAPVGDLE